MGKKQMKKSSFVRKGKAAKKGVSQQLPEGSIISVYNNQLVTSTGLKDFDDIIGGGIIVGSVVLVEEDLNTHHYSTLLKYFLSEGLACHQKLIFVSGEAPELDTFLHSLPTTSTLNHEADQEKKSQENMEAMKIAWRYKTNIKDSHSRETKTYCHNYDLSRKIKAHQADEVVRIDVNSLPVSAKEKYEQLYKLLHAQVKQSIEKMIKDPAGPKQIVRIAIQSIGSAFWNSPEESRELISFLHALRGLMRGCLGVCMLSMPSYLYPALVVKRIQHLTDLGVALHSFEGKGEVVPAEFEEYNGLFYLRKLMRLNSLTCFTPSTLSFGFKRKKRKFYIEELHLGPEPDRSDQTDNSKLICQPSATKKGGALDF